MCVYIYFYVFFLIAERITAISSTKYIKNIKSCILGENKSTKPNLLIDLTLHYSGRWAITEFLSWAELYLAFW